MSIKTIARAGLSAAALGFASIALPAPAQAGFFEQLFGVAPPPPPVTSYNYDEPQVERRAPVAPQRRKIVDEKPKLQKPTDLMRDPTLMAGDAVMMKDGIHIYTGYDDASKHTKKDFLPIDDVSGLSKRERSALVAMDTSRNDPLRGSIAPDTLASGRSAAVASPIVAGKEIVDARGNRVRYVGP